MQIKTYKLNYYMKRILILFIAASMAYGCKSSKGGISTTKSESKTIDNKLEEVWVLDEMNGKKVTADDFAKSLPKIEINSPKANFTGNSGCNAIKGNLFSRRNGEIQFLNVTSEKNKCAAARKEDEFLRLLKSNTTYSKRDDKLLLSNQFGPTLVFKKNN